MRKQQKLEEQRCIRRRKKECGGSDGVDDAVAEAAVVAQIRNKNEDSILGPRETRKVIRIARDLFSSSIDHDLSNEALARAKLRSICGEYDNTNSNSSSSSTSSSSSPFRADKKMWRLNSWYYLGLHYDVLDDDVASRDCMKMALRQCAFARHADDSKSIFLSVSLLFIFQKGFLTNGIVLLTDYYFVFVLLLFVYVFDFVFRCCWNAP